ncbi:hypothetical protein RhiirA5_498959 [Rhizophagus irregularis]|uniref:DUF8211 domain-containing protein n=1 Tax=Rhizophagus irregularis TaxID=588596 RepID=A0A2N0PSH7_9GLOM|nr:hypothetical protein RhiirA5_498959 [Rhizophagus irregularis]
MSYNRRACIDHHSGTFLNLFANVKNPIQPDSLLTSTTPKGHHASHLFNKSSMKTVKHVFSKRQGTSYDVNYNHYPCKLIECTDTRTMYYKHLSRFRITTPTKSTSFSKQHERFERNCRRTFNKDKSHIAEASEINDRLATANRQRFLFFHPQNINSPITHLKYKECNPRKENYSFPIPIHSTKNIRLDSPSTQKVNPSSPLVKHKYRYTPRPSTYCHEISNTPNNPWDGATLGMVNKYSEHRDFMYKFEAQRQFNLTRQNYIASLSRKRSAYFSDADISSIASYDSAQTHQSSISLETPVPSPPAVAGPSNYNHPTPISPLPVKISPELSNSNGSPPNMTTSSTLPPAQIEIRQFDLFNSDPSFRYTISNLFSPPQSHNEAFSSSDEYITADSDDKDSAELFNSPPAPLKIVQLDNIFNQNGPTPVYDPFGCQKPKGFE